MLVKSKQYHSLANLITIQPQALEGIFSDISNGVTITDEHSKIIYVNPAFTAITGYQAKEVINDNPGLLHSGRHDKAYYKTMWDTIQTLGRWQGEIWNRCKNGGLIPELLTITKVVNQDNHPFYIGIFSDISSIIQENEKKINLAFHDPLTGLCNRSLLEDRFDVIRKEYIRDKKTWQARKKQMALLFIDLDRFKQVNDIHGHLVGDKILQFVADKLQKNSRSIDTVARIGGDEFAVMITSLHEKAEITSYCERVRHALNQGVAVDGIHLTPALSIGCCFFPSQAETWETLMANADKTMYYAKQHKTFLHFYEG